VHSPWHGLNEITPAVLSQAERAFLGSLIGLLDEIRPPQLDERDTALTAEGRHSLIALMPHRALGGIAIVVWLSPDAADVTWAQVAQLWCCHDSLDLGVWVQRFQIDHTRPDFGPILDCIRAQFAAPITLKLHDSQHADVFVSDPEGGLRKVGALGSRRGWKAPFAHLKLGEPQVVHFVDHADPPVTEPAGVDDWFSKSP